MNNKQSLWVERLTIVARVVILVFALSNVVLVVHANAARIINWLFGANQRNVDILFDVTPSIPTDYRPMMIACTKGLLENLDENDGVSIIGITENSFARPLILLQGTLPADDHPLQPRYLSARDNLLTAWQTRSAQIEFGGKVTDVFGAIAFASLQLERKSGDKWLIVQSDLRNSTPVLDIEHVEEIDCEKSLECLKRAGLIPNLRGVKVVILGMHTTGKTQRYYQSLQKFVLKYFELTGAQVVTMQPDFDWVPFTENKQ